VNRVQKHLQKKKIAQRWLPLARHGESTGLEIWDLIDHGPIGSVLSGHDLLSGWKKQNINFATFVGQGAFVLKKRIYTI